MLAWVFFRSASLADAWTVLNRMFRLQPGSELNVSGEIWLLVAGFLLVEWIQRGRPHALDWGTSRLPLWGRWLFCYAVLFLLLKFGGEQQDFIYFQF